MKKFGIFFISLLFITISLSAQESTIARFQGEQINGVMISGTFKVQIARSADTGAEVTISDKMADKLVYELTEDGYVRIGYGGTVDNLFINNKNIPTVKIKLPVLNMLKLSGDVQLLSSGEFAADNFIMSLSGSSVAQFVKVDCSRATVTCEDSSKADELTLKSTGNVMLETNSLSRLYIRGSAPKTTVVATASSRIDMLMFETPKIIATTSGTSTVKANVSGTASLIKKGTSSFRYIGEGEISGDKAKKL